MGSRGEIPPRGNAAGRFIPPPALGGVHPMAEAAEAGSRPPEGFLGRRFRRRALLLETIRPLEVPVVTETKRRDGLGDRAGAIRYAYLSVLSDLERAFDVSFPPHWTHAEILERGMTAEMDPIPDFLRRLLALYSPVRYGATAGPPADPTELVVSIYSHRRMWGLYAERLLRSPPAPSLAPHGGAR